MSIFTDLAEHGRLPFSEGRMLPPAAYTSAEVLAEEHRRIFACEWMCVGRTADLPNRGDYMTAEIPAAQHAPGHHRSIMVVRGDDDRLSAFDNVCVHRGSPLLDGCGNQSRITCPYHAWVYRLDGQLIGAPYMDRNVDRTLDREFDPAEHGLTELRLEVWEGFVFVAQDPAITPLAERLGALTDVVGRYQMAGYVPVHRQVDVWDTNWKLLYENFMDAYHVFKVHKNSFAKNGDNTALTTMHEGGDHHAYHLVGHSPDAISGVAHPDNTSLDGEWRHTIVLGAVFPTHVMQLQPDWLWYLQLSPIGVGQVRIRWDVSAAPEMLADQRDPDAYVANLLGLLNLVNSEDRPIVEGVFRGVHSPNISRGPLSYLERNVFEFDRYIARSLS